MSLNQSSIKIGAGVVGHVTPMRLRAMVETVSRCAPESQLPCDADHSVTLLTLLTNV